MSKTGLIYEIVCNETYERYVGSTFEPTVARRIAGHKVISACMSKQIIGRGNYSYGLLEKVNVDTRDELRMYERKWYDALDCINKYRPYITEEERVEQTNNYYQEHKEQIKEQTNKYRQEHKEQIKEQSNEYYQEHKEQIKERTNKYRQEHKEQHNLANKKYRLKQKALKSSISIQPPLEQP
jgi:hypothetical protein